MLKDEIIEMARQAGFVEYELVWFQQFEAFAKLVAAKEREACAKVAENGCNYPCADEIAAAIRARGET